MAFFLSTIGLFTLLVFWPLVVLLHFTRRYCNIHLLLFMHCGISQVDLDLFMKVEGQDQSIHQIFLSATVCVITIKTCPNMLIESATGNFEGQAKESCGQFVSGEDVFGVLLTGYRKSLYYTCSSPTVCSHSSGPDSPPTRKVRLRLAIRSVNINIFTNPSYLAFLLVIKRSIHKNVSFYI